MKRWILYGALFAAVLLLPKISSSGTDVGQLEPVELVRISTKNGAVSIRTDTGESGKGKTLEQAILDLKRTADGEVFLDTVDYLLITPPATKYLSELADILRPACCVCLENGEADLEKVAPFLSVHKPNRTLGEYRRGQKKLPAILMREDRMYLVQP